MHISTIEINGQKRACINRPAFGNVSNFVFITVDNGLFDESLGQTINPTIQTLIDRALRSGAVALQMSGNDMIGKTTFAIYSKNINTPVLTALKSLDGLLVIDNIKTVKIGYFDNGVRYVTTWTDVMQYDVVTASQLAELEAQYPATKEQIQTSEDVKQMIRDLNLTAEFDLRKSETTLKTELIAYYNYS